MTYHELTRSITGEPEVHVLYREVWADQIDGYADPCPVCQMQGNLISCNVYVPGMHGALDLINTCACCALPALLDHPGLNTAHDAVIEHAKGHRL